MSDALEALESVELAVRGLVDWFCENVDGQGDSLPDGLAADVNAATDSLSTIRAALEQGEAEPFGWLGKWNNGTYDFFTTQEEIDKWSASGALQVTPVYTAPPSTAESRGQLEQAYMAGQADLGIDPCWSSAQDYASKIRGSKPDEAEAQARALVEFAVGLKQQAQQTHSMFSEGLLHAARYAEAEAKRIREEG